MFQGHAGPCWALNVGLCDAKDNLPDQSASPASGLGTPQSLEVERVHARKGYPIGSMLQINILVQLVPIKKSSPFPDSKGCKCPYIKQKLRQHKL